MRKTLLILFLAFSLFSFTAAGKGASEDAETTDSYTLALQGEYSIPTSTGMPPVIVVSGSNYEMGRQYGERFARQIFRNSAVTKAKVMTQYGVEIVKKDMRVNTYYAEKYDPAFKEWLKGIEAGCEKAGYRISYEELMLITVFPSETWTRPVGPYPEETGVTGSSEPLGPATINLDGACTTFAAKGAATKDGKPMVAISGGSGIEVLDRVILVAFPDEGPSYTSFGIIGRPHDQMGMNSSGFAWVLTANFSKNPPWGVNGEIPFHYLTQYCNSPAEAQRYIQSIPRTGATGNFVMSDAAGNISVVETNADCFAIRVPGDLGEKSDFVVNANHFAGEDTIACNLPDWKKWNADSIYRYATCWEYVSAAAETSGIDFDFVKKMFHSDDWYDPEAKKWHYNEPGSGNGFDILGYTHGTIFRPADLTAYYMQGTNSGVGIPAGATGEFVKIQLAEDPGKVAANMSKAALDYYIDARNLLRKALNSGSERLTDFTAGQMEELLDNAWLDYERGMDRAAFAYMAEIQEAPVDDRLLLWSQAMTNYTRAQLNAQMVSTRIQAVTDTN